MIFVDCVGAGPWTGFVRALHFQIVNYGGSYEIFLEFSFDNGGFADGTGFGHACPAFDTSIAEGMSELIK